VFLLKSQWPFLLYPTLIGAILVVLVAVVYNNASRSSNYPKYW
jgi:CBS-domain-containing membrane protein